MKVVQGPASLRKLNRMHPRLKKLLIAFALLAAPLVLINGLTVLGDGPWSTAGIELFLLPAVAALVALPIVLLTSLARRFRTGALDMAATFLGLALGSSFGAIAGGKLRMYAFELAAERAAPLVAAIKVYEHHHGGPPQTLEALIPAHLPRLPDKLPPLDLVTGEIAMKNYENNKWALVACVSGGLLNWDTFIYLPRQNYPEAGYGGTLKRIGDWAYVHE